MLLLRLIGAVIAGVFMAVFGALVCGLLGTVFYEVLFTHGASLSSFDPTDMSMSSPGTLIGVGLGLLMGLIVFVRSVSYAFKRDRLSRGACAFPRL
ncbi:hypothetical protein [Ktedonospora formicarum]|uniref:Uncharacterized protein n=1 Tax=Ktedonospora formicarum TaxID=2778364 RepID=A0A8J3I7C0_9CHLR|nr:hypothetical protein [Ktedonospora formicarum]GHO46759.1 hypothetical protein KSX_49220 [Ktedonospora formicarum]